MFVKLDRTSDRKRAQNGLSTGNPGALKNFRPVRKIDFGSEDAIHAQRQFALACSTLDEPDRRKVQRLTTADPGRRPAEPSRETIPIDPGYYAD
jgi:hypothetical protein